MISNKDSAIILDVYLDAATLLYDLVDSFSALTDNLFDFIWVDFHDVDLGSMRAKF